jgi:hypothetical protein
MKDRELNPADVDFLRRAGVVSETSLEEAVRVLKTNNNVLRYMINKKIPLTRDNYLSFAYFGDPPDELSAEEEAELPEFFQLDPGEEFE